MSSTGQGSNDPAATGPPALGATELVRESARMVGYVRDVLLVEPDPVERERLAAALEGDGFQVRLCSGPASSDHSCVGIRERRCQLATDNCIVVLDMVLDRDAGAPRPSAVELLRFYLEADHGVISLSARPPGIEDARLIPLTRHPEAGVLLAAVWRSASPSHGGRRPESAPGG